MNDKPWENRALQDLEEALPPLKAEEPKRTASRYKTRTGVGVDGVQPKVPLDLSIENVLGNCGIIGESGAIWLLASAGLRALYVIGYSEECHERKTDCVVAYAYSMVGMVENASDSRMEEKKLSEMRCHRRMQ